MDKQINSGSPPALKDGGIKERIKDILKKPTKVILISSIALVAAIVIFLAVMRSGNAEGNSPSKITFPGDSKVLTYVLENMTENDKFLHLSKVTLYDDGTAQLATPPISSYLLPECTFEFSGEELLIYANIVSHDEEGFFGIKDGQVVARFTVADQNTLVFKSAEVPLFAQGGARYVLVDANDEETPPRLTLYPGVPADPDEAKPIAENEEGLYRLDHVITAAVHCPWALDITVYFTPDGSEEAAATIPFPIEKDIDVHMVRIDVGDIFPQGFHGSVRAVARSPEGIEQISNILNVIYPGSGSAAVSEPVKWLDYYFDEEMPWDKTLELTLPEYPDTIFKWTPNEVRAIGPSEEKTLFTGMPIWNVYLADLTGDGNRELCATVSFGSGIIDERIIVCDYTAGKNYELSDRMNYDYCLFPDNGHLLVKKTKYPGPEGEVVATGELAIVDGRLTITGIDLTGQ